jgi:hypothetical protein
MSNVFHAEEIVFWEISIQVAMDQLGGNSHRVKGD